MALPDTLKTPDLLPALAWATQLIAESGHIGGFRGKNLADAIMFKAWQAFDHPELTRPFLEHIAARLRHHGGLCRGTDHDKQKAFMNALRDSVDKRHRFLLALCAGPLTRIEVYGYRRSGFLLDSDLEWLLSVAPGGSNAAPDLNAESLCNLIECAFVIDNVAHFEAVYAAAERWPALRARATPSACVSIPRKSHAREQQARLRAWKNDRPPPIAVDPAGQILARLEEAEAGRWQAWWQLTYYSMLTPESRAFGDELDYFVTAMPGWGEADGRHRRLRRTILGRSRNQHRCLAGPSAMPVCRNAIAGLRASSSLNMCRPPPDAVGVSR